MGDAVGVCCALKMICLVQRFNSLIGIFVILPKINFLAEGAGWFLNFVSEGDGAMGQGNILVLLRIHVEA